MLNEKYKYKGLVINNHTMISEPFTITKKTDNSLYVYAKCNKCSTVSRQRFMYITNKSISNKCKCFKSNGSKNRTKSLFDYWMSKWDKTTHSKKYAKLPYFSGTVGQEYITGFTYIDSEKYTEFSKVMWIKPKHYVVFNYSKDNCERLGIEHVGSKISCQFLHRGVLCLKKTDNLLGDHINGLSLDNRRNNLRKATPQQNNFNTKKSEKVKYKGVSYREDRKCYKACLTYNNKYISINTFKCEEDAAIARDLLALSYHKEFAKLNFPDRYNCIKKLEHDSKFIRVYEYMKFEKRMISL